MRFLQTEFAQFAEALLAQRGQVDGGADSQQRLVGADIGGGAFAANMLLAGLQCQYVASLLLRRPLQPSARRGVQATGA